MEVVMIALIVALVIAVGLLIWSIRSNKFQVLLEYSGLTPALHRKLETSNYRLREGLEKKRDNLIQEAHYVAADIARAGMQREADVMYDVALLVAELYDDFSDGLKRRQSVHFKTIVKHSASLRFGLGMGNALSARYSKWLLEFNRWSWVAEAYAHKLENEPTK